MMMKENEEEEVEEEVAEVDDDDSPMRSLRINEIHQRLVAEAGRVSISDARPGRGLLKKLPEGPRLALENIALHLGRDPGAVMIATMRLSQESGTL